MTDEDLDDLHERVHTAISAWLGDDDVEFISIVEVMGCVLADHLELVIAAEPEVDPFALAAEMSAAVAQVVFRRAADLAERETMH